MENRIIFVLGMLGILGAVGGIFGGMIFQSTKIMLIGLAVWILCLIIILGRAAWNYLDC